MKSPYEKDIDPYNHRTLYPEEEALITGGYEFIGWANAWNEDKPEKYRHCVNEAHNYHSAFPGVWNSAQHTPSGSDVTQWCTRCRIYWKVDMSD